MGTMVAISQRIPSWALTARPSSLPPTTWAQEAPRLSQPFLPWMRGRTDRSRVGDQVGVPASENSRARGASPLRGTVRSASRSRSHSGSAPAPRGDPARVRASMRRVAECLQLDPTGQEQLPSQSTAGAPSRGISSVTCMATAS